MILYRVDWKEKITEVESERQTDKSVFVNGVRNAWKSDWTAYFKDKEEAKKFIIDDLVYKIQQHEERLRLLGKKLIAAEQI